MNEKTSKLEIVYKIVASVLILLIVGIYSWIVFPHVKSALFRSSSSYYVWYLPMLLVILLKFIWFPGSDSEDEP